MTVERYIRVIAGLFIMVSLALGWKPVPFREQVVSGLHRLCEAEPVPIRADQFLPLAIILKNSACPKTRSPAASADGRAAAGCWPFFLTRSALCGGLN